MVGGIPHDASWAIKSSSQQPSLRMVTIIFAHVFSIGIIHRDAGALFL